jgi:hypothetical protein
MYLSHSNQLLASPSKEEAVHSYDSTERGVGSNYDYVVPERATLAGFSKIRLYMSCKEHNDPEIYVTIRKLSRSGELMEQSNVPLHESPPEVKTVKGVKNVSPCKYLGPIGMLRASHREYDPKKSIEYWPFHTHRRAEFVVELDIGIWHRI